MFQSLHGTVRQHRGFYPARFAALTFRRASLRAPRVGNEKMGRPDEPHAFECKDRLRVLCSGKVVKVLINYERDMPMGPEVCS